MDSNLVGSVGVLLALGVFFSGSGWYYYRGADAGRLLKDQFIFRLLPGAACALPVCGVACFGLALTLLAPQSVKVLLLAISILTGLVALILFGWCPRKLLPPWLREARNPRN